MTRTSSSSIESASTAADAPRIAALLSSMLSAASIALGNEGTSAKLESSQSTGLSTITGGAPAPVALAVLAVLPFGVAPWKFWSALPVELSVLAERHLRAPSPKSTTAYPSLLTFMTVPLAPFLSVTLTPAQISVPVESVAVTAFAGGSVAVTVASSYSFTI